MKPDNEVKAPRNMNKLWVPVVVLIGAALGVLSYTLTRENEHFPPFGAPQAQMFETLREFHAIFSTIGIALLVALIIVYARTYRQTRANFMLGILVVLFALLFQSFLTHPLLFDLVEHTRFQAGFSSPVADTFTILAYAVFLYLSLE